MLVVGGGTAGLTAALAARHQGASVALVEREERVGGDCTFYGCVPSKTLTEAAALLGDARRAAADGVLTTLPELDFGALMRRVARVVEAIAADERDARFSSAGIGVVHGAARFVGPHALDADGVRLEASRFVLATGSEPVVPPLPGLERARVLTNRTIFSLERLPARLVVLGGGVTGLELAQAFARFGSRVTVLERADGLLGAEEPETAAAATAALAADGVDVRLGANVTEAGEDFVVADGERIDATAILVAAGRRASTDDLGLEHLGLEPGGDGRLHVDGRCGRTPPTSTRQAMSHTPCGTRMSPPTPAPSQARTPRAHGGGRACGSSRRSRFSIRSSRGSA